MRPLSRIFIGLALLLLPATVATAAPFAYITNAGSDNVSVIDTATNAVVATIPVGVSPTGVAVSADGTRVYIANSGSDSVSVIDATRNSILATVATGIEPSGVAVNAAGTRVYVTNAASDSVSVIDATRNSVVATVPVGAIPLGVVVNPAGTRVYVANSDASRVSVIDTGTNSVIAGVPVGAVPYAIAVNPAGTRIYVTHVPDTEPVNGTVTVIDAASNAIVAVVPLGLNVAATGVTTNAAGTRVYAAGVLGGVFVIDAGSNRLIDTLGVEGVLGGIAINGAGTRIYVANIIGDTVAVVDLASRSVIARVPVGSLPFALGQFIGPAAPAPGGASPVVEYYHAGFDHYFITWMPGEIAKLDAGVEIRGWARTGYSFKTYTTAQAGTSPVCRYYIPPALGDSHFFGRGTVECNETGRKNPSFVLEDPSFMQMFLPAAGVCPAGTVQVYRVFSNRPDANHRYMTDRAVRDQMVAKGWLAEGDGPDLVVMCAPQ
jgi:YVTN family beta-propeller protein